MVTLKDIETTDDLNRKHELSQQWGQERGFSHSYPGLLVMRYIERLEAQAKPLTWTTEKPTKEGLHYWWRDQSYKGNTPFICKIVKHGGELVTVFAEMNEDDLNDHVTVLHSLEGGEWAGPIEEPL